MSDTDTINRDADQAEAEGPAPDLLQAEADAVLDGITDAAPVEPITGGAGILAAFNEGLMQKAGSLPDMTLMPAAEVPAPDVEGTVIVLQDQLQRVREHIEHLTGGPSVLRGETHVVRTHPGLYLIPAAGGYQAGSIDSALIWPKAEAEALAERSRAHPGSEGAAAVEYLQALRDEEAQLAHLLREITPDPEDVDASATLADPMAVMEAVHAVLRAAARTMGLPNWLAWSPPVDSLADAEPADVEQFIDAVQRLRAGEHPADVHDAWCADSIQRRGLGLGDGADVGTRPHLLAWCQLDGEVRGALIAVAAMLQAT
jgi:hypothetical protein